MSEALLKHYRDKNGISEEQEQKQLEELESKSVTKQDLNSLGEVVAFFMLTIDDLGSMNAALMQEIEELKERLEVVEGA
ncbi:hypothetical protein [Chengkuizengella marina]|uniref:Uncharacterized protein n=1 Tax=Chengkuizengella marina TaxID=2507566 RepID=A0A6N9Q8S7_9BACL|nr:hypothetical protein [Chengkuizengella marina]NBI31239.1 hypothetical protein [Chengkuizengella marina]